MPALDSVEHEPEGTSGRRTPRRLSKRTLSMIVAVIIILVFVVLNVTGTIFRLWIIQVIGNIFDKPIDSVIGFIQDYRVPVIIASVLLVLFTIWNERRHGESEIEALTRLEDELEAEQTDE